MSKISGEFYMPFFEGFQETLEQFGVSGIARSDLELKESLYMDNEVNIIVGLTEEMQGNVGYSMPSDTAKQLVSMAMGGMPVEQIDEMARSALSEMANMTAASAATKISAKGKKMDITPPTLVLGRNIYMIINQVQTLTIELTSSAGPMQVNIGLENVT